MQSSARIKVVNAIRRMPLPPKRKPSKYERRAAGYASPGDSAKVCPDFALILLSARLPHGRLLGTPRWATIARRTTGSRPRSRAGMQAMKGSPDRPSSQAIARPCDVWRHPAISGQARLSPRPLWSNRPKVNKPPFPPWRGSFFAVSAVGAAAVPPQPMWPFSYVALWA